MKTPREGGLEDAVHHSAIIIAEGNLGYPLEIKETVGLFSIEDSNPSINPSVAISEPFQRWCILISFQQTTQ